MRRGAEPRRVDGCAEIVRRRDRQNHALAGSSRDRTSADRLQDLQLGLDLIN
jgi:hypothetical protein